MSFAANPSATYHRHSGRFSWGGAAMALVVGCVTAVPLAAAYAYLDLYIPWIFLNLVLTGGTGFALGYVVSRLLIAGKVRNTGVAMLIGLIAGGVLFVAAWDVWVFGLLQRNQNAVTLMDVITDPSFTWDAIVQINQQGAWSLSGGTAVTGIPLAIVWLVEAGCLLGIPMATVRKAVTAFPFCEKCDKWCVTRELIDLNAGEEGALRGRLEARDFAALSVLGKAPFGAMQFWSVYLQGCAGCDTTQTLCVDAVNITTDKNGKVQRKVKSIVKRLLLTPEDTVSVAVAVAALSKPEDVAPAAPGDKPAATPPAPQAPPPSSR